MKSNLDFKEVFKWTTSPLLVKKLGVPANLDGQFHINCTFYDTEQENQLLETLMDEIQSFKGPQAQKNIPKWKKK